MVEQLSGEQSVSEVCELLQVVRSGYYAWLEAGPSAREQANQALGEKIQEVFSASRGTYGSPRVTAELHHRGERCNHKRVERLMQEAGLQGCRAKRRRVKTTQSEHEQPIAPNLLLGQDAPQHADQVWVADITYVPTQEGWLYLAAVMDLYSRQILGWSVQESLATELTLEALEEALVRRSYPRGVIHHSDRGIQYASGAYREELANWGLIPSMSRRGNCYDNAAMEAFWSTVKREALEQSIDWSKDQVRRELFEYIEAIYNRKRLHSSLGYKSPVDFEHQNN
jgi:putative transposase